MKVVYYQRNKERIKKQREGFRKRNKILMKHRNKEWYKKNKDYHQSQDAKQKRREYRHRPEVLKRRSEYQINKRKNNSAYSMKLRLSNSLNMALNKFSKMGKVQASGKYGIDISAIIEYLKPLPANLSDYEVHHIKPLFTFDFNNLEEIKKAFAPENHKLLLIEEHRKINHWNFKISNTQE